MAREPQPVDGAAPAKGPRNARVQPAQRFVCTDGAEFADPADADKHQDSIQQREALRAVVDRFHYNGIDSEEVVAGIINNFRDIVAAYRNQDNI